MKIIIRKKKIQLIEKVYWNWVEFSSGIGISWLK